jgi:hypothetical protein
MSTQQSNLPVICRFLLPPPPDLSKSLNSQLFLLGKEESSTIQGIHSNPPWVFFLEEQAKECKLTAQDGLLTHAGGYQAFSGLHA